MTASNPTKVQIAVQGGGARLVALIAAMQALEDLSREIEVTRLAGTSAGAIAAVLFAARIPMGQVRAVLTAKRDELINAWQMPTGLGATWNIAFGKPLWSHRALEEILTELIVTVGRSKTGGRLNRNSCFSELAIPVMVISTDLANLAALKHEEAKGIISSVMASAGLPFLFRSLKSNPSNPVDGGICENLPSTYLLPDEAAYGPTIGFSFSADRPTRGPGSVIEYALSLVNCAINHSTERSKQLLGPRCIKLPTNIQTFEFKHALNAGLGADFDEVVRETKGELTRIVSLAQAETSAPTVQGKPDVSDEDWKPASKEAGLKRYNKALRAVGEMYTRQHHQQKIRYESGKLVCVAHSLANPQFRDQITSSSKITTSREPVYCHRAALGQSGLPETILDESEIQVFDSAGNKVETIVVPMETSTDQMVREVLLCFDPVLTPQTGPYTLSCKSWFSDFVKPLRDSGRDQIGLFMTRAEGAIPQLDIVLLYPKTFGHIKVTEASCAYQEIPVAELAAAHSAVAPQDFILAGWRARNTPSLMLSIARA